MILSVVTNNRISLLHFSESRTRYDPRFRSMALPTFTMFAQRRMSEKHCFFKSLRTA